MFVNYEEFFDDTQGGFTQILDYIGCNVHDSLIEEMLVNRHHTRLNKGVTGRGKQAFSQDPLAYQMLVGLLDCYPTVDFSPIFTPLNPL